MQKKVCCSAYEQKDRERPAQRHSMPDFFEALLQDEWKLNVAMKIRFNSIARIISHDLFICPFLSITIFENYLNGMNLKSIGDVAKLKTLEIQTK